jgi:hypothetical protein
MLPVANEDTARSRPEQQLTPWERENAMRWGRYLAAAEQRALELGAALVACPGAALEVGCEGGRWSAW